MKDFHKYEYKHLKIIVLSMLAMIVIGMFSSCASQRGCPQAYGYDFHNPNKPFKAP